MATSTTHSNIFRTSLQINVRLSPYFTKNLRVGVENLLNKALLKHLPAAGGILLAYDNLKLVDAAGQIVHEQCETHFRIRCEALVLRLRKGTLLKGTVNKVSSNHIGLLVHGLFNASISMDELRNGMSFRSDEGIWVEDDYMASASGHSKKRKAPKKPTIFCVGTRLLFEVIGLRSKTGLVSIAGTMNLSTAEHIALAKQLDKEERRRRAASKSNEASDEEKDGDEETAASDDELKATAAKKKKKKLSETPTVSSDEEKVAGTQQFNDEGDDKSLVNTNGSQSEDGVEDASSKLSHDDTSTKSAKKKKRKKSKGKAKTGDSADPTGQNKSKKKKAKKIKKKKKGKKVNGKAGKKRKASELAS